MYALGQIMNCKEDMQYVRICDVCLRADYELQREVMQCVRTDYAN